MLISQISPLLHVSDLWICTVRLSGGLLTPLFFLGSYYFCFKLMVHLPENNIFVLENYDLISILSISHFVLTVQVGNEERIHVYYAHGQDYPTFVRRCYWLLDKYVNVSSNSLLSLCFIIIIIFKIRMPFFS